MTVFFLIFVFLNLYGLLGMYFDKQSARKQARRVSEAHLWGIGLIGGSIGIWLGMTMFRHKTKHWTFRWGVPFLILVQLLLYINLV